MSKRTLAAASALALAGLVIGVWLWSDRGGDSTKAQSPVDIANEKLKLHGEPTLPPDTDLSKPRVIPTITPGGSITIIPATALPAKKCGPRDDGKASTDVLAPYGEVRLGCALFETQWVITTLGETSTGTTGVIAIYSCTRTDAECLAGGEPSLSGDWAVYEPPRTGGVTVLGVVGSSTLVINNAGAQMCFDLTTHTYDTDPGCAEK